MSTFRWDARTFRIKYAFDSQIKRFPKLRDLYVTKKQYQDLLGIVDVLSRESKYIYYKGENGFYYLINNPEL